jgi:Flp pilus assembly pilin Flp
MLKLYVWMKNLLSREEGQDVIEYALISALISVGIVSVVLLTGMVGAFGTWATAVADAVGGPFPVL